MAFDVSALDTVINDSNIVADAILKAETKGLGVSIFPGQKAGVNFKLNKVATTIFPREMGCSYSSSGTTTFTNNTVVPKALQNDQSFCPKDLYPVYLGQLFSTGTNQEDFPESEFIYGLLTDEILAYNDEKMWLGNTGSGDHINGYMTIIGGQASRISGTTISAPTSSNIDDMVDDMYTSLVANAPELLKEKDLKLVLSPANFALWTKTLRDANLYNYGQHNDDFETGVMIPGTNVLVKALNALVGSDKALLGSMKNLALVLDGISDEEEIDVHWSKDDREIKTTSVWTLGVGFFTYDQVVTNF